MRNLITSLSPLLDSKDASCIQQRRHSTLVASYPETVYFEDIDLENSHPLYRCDKDDINLMNELAKAELHLEWQTSTSS